ncbi:hypothetical protein DFH27DRAFT_640387 [Peziza echinospora]|nr:hypothetical protein DFH27DRAFT_640387 [Peziza echinospora]
MALSILRLALPGRGRQNNRNSIVIVFFISIATFLAVYFEETSGILTQTAAVRNGGQQVSSQSNGVDSAPINIIEHTLENQQQCPLQSQVTITVTQKFTQFLEQTKSLIDSAPQTTSKSKFPVDVFRAYDEDYQDMLTPEDRELISTLRSYKLKEPTKKASEGAQTSDTPLIEMQREAHIRAFRNLYSIGSGLPSAPHTWLEYIDGLDPNMLAPLTHIAQNYLHNHQNPSKARCERDTLFLVLPSYRTHSGLGSILHGASHALSTAIRSGRVLIYDERDGDGNGKGMPGTIFSGPQGCHSDGDRKVLGMDCFFQSVTSCSWSNVRLDGEDANALLYKPYDSTGNANFKHPVFGYKTRYGDIPPVLGSLLLEWEDINSAGSRIRTSPNSRKLWWRAQAVGYLARINNKSLEVIRKARLGEFQTENLLPLKRSGLRGNTSVLVPFPLPQGALSIHVRHGDKAGEMDLVPFSSYVLAAEKIANENPWRDLVSKAAFVTTEDPKVIGEIMGLSIKSSNISTLQQTTSNLEWTFFWTDGVPRHNSGPAAEMTQASSEGIAAATTLVHLGELMMSLEATGGWVGTRASNWCKLIDELAGVWVGKGGIFIEVGNPMDWVDYHF